jgi:hypothetical protein
LLPGGLLFEGRPTRGIRLPARISRAFVPPCIPPYRGLGLPLSDQRRGYSAGTLEAHSATEGCNLCAATAICHLGEMLQ